MKTKTQHCANLHVHGPHTQLVEEPTPSRYGQSSASYFAECPGTNVEQSAFAKWCVDMLEEPLSNWEISLLIQWTPEEREGAMSLLIPKGKAV